LDEFATEDDVGVEVGLGEEMGWGVSIIMGGVPLVPLVFPLPPKLITLPGPGLGTEDGEFKPFAERNEISGEACSGERVVVVGGRVSVG
jgi:hypothetical protein